MKGQNLHEPYEYPFISYDYSGMHVPRFRDFMANNKFINVNNKISIDYYNKNYDNSENNIFLENYEEFQKNQIKIDHNTPLFYLNLETKKDSRKIIEDLISYLGFAYSRRFRTINTNTIRKIEKYKELIHENLYNKLVDKNMRDSRLMKIEDVGLYLSYYKLFRNIIEQNIPLSFIITDKFTIHSKKDYFWNVCKRIVIPEDMDILSIYSILGENFTPQINLTENLDVMRCILVTKQGAEKLVKLMFPIKNTIEKELSQLCNEKKINLYELNISNL
jgi:hypothetical protein